MMSVQLSLAGKMGRQLSQPARSATWLATRRLGRLAARMRNLKGRFLHSINDLPEVRRVFRGASP